MNFKAIVLTFGLVYSISLQAQFTAIPNTLPGTFGSNVQFADFDNDADLDFILSGSTHSGGVGITKLYRNNGNFNFSVVTTPFSGVYHSSIDWADYNNDGYLDVVICGLSNYGNPPVTRVYKGNSGGTFTQIADAFFGADNANTKWGDYNNDGLLDLIVTGSRDYFAYTEVYRNNGNDSFALVDLGLPPVEYGSVNFIDYDLDGDLDIFLCGNLIASLYRNDGTGIYTPVNVGFEPVLYACAAWGDYDNDGYPDVVYCGNNPGSVPITRLYRNLGDGTFSSIPVGIPGIISGSVEWGDYNNDGLSDILLTGNISSARISNIYRNNGNHTFAELDMGFTPVSSSWAAWGDLNNDGKLDVVLSGYTGSSYVSEIYRNDTPGSNQAPTAPQLHFNPVTKILSYSFVADDHTPQAGLSYAVRIGTTPGGSQIMSAPALANGLRKLPKQGRKHQMFQPQPGIQYYAAAQAIDTGLMGSAFGPEICFTINGMPSISVQGNGMVDFGQGYINYPTAPRELRIYNTGHADLWIDSLAITGNPAVFNIDGTTPLTPVSCQPGDSLSVYLRFMPLEIGVTDAYLVIYSNAENQTELSITLSGSGVHAPPAEVQNVSIQMQGTNAVLSWDPVCTDIFGNYMVPDRYIVLFNELPDNDHFWFLSSTLSPGFMHQEVGLFSSGMFYQIKAVKFYRSEDREVLETVERGKTRVLWQDISLRITE